jgi:dihydroorotate dehydrogenase
MYSIIRFFLFLFDPEKVHHFTAKAIHIVLSVPGMKWLWKKMYVIDDRRLEKEVFGLTFKNPVGLGAGFDKDAKMFNDLAYCGFGFIEIGTITPVGQPGNEKPRLFRVKEDEGIINRMGFNNEGAEIAAERLKHKTSNIIIGGNIGKNKVTANEDALQDYRKSFQILFPFVDYFVVNVSSPNTPNLRDLQEKEPLMALLSELVNENNQNKSPKPILLKIAPDLTDGQLDDIIEIVEKSKIQGVIATNTTISRDNLKTDSKIIESIGAGGLSGTPVKNRSTEVIRYLSEKSNKAFPIIGIGGIHSEQDALEKLDAGADLIQLYTGFIYEGPGLIKRINKAILARMK